MTLQRKRERKKRGVFKSVKKRMKENWMVAEKEETKERKKEK